GAIAHMHCSEAYVPLSSWARSSSIRAACFGIAGIVSSSDRAAYDLWLHGLDCKVQYAICDDFDLVLGGGTPAGWGIALVAADSTAMCIATSPDGRHRSRVDSAPAGSGHAIATRALDAAM